MLVGLLSPAWMMAQSATGEAGLRSSGKIYIVVGVILIILLGLLIYLISLDRKIKQLEKRFPSERDTRPSPHTQPK